MAVAWPLRAVVRPASRKGGWDWPCRSFGGEAALSVEARYLEPQLPIELDDAYGQTFERLRRLFRSRGCTPEEAADLAQEAAVRAFVHIRRWGVSGDGLDPLLNRIAGNLLIDRYRRTTPHLVPLDSAGDLHDPEQDPTEEVDRRQRRQAVHRAIRELPHRHRTAITYTLSGLSPEEVGRQMGIGRNAADALLHRARRSLKEHLSSVREGAWGIAFGVRMKWDRLTRRAGVESRLTDSSFLAAANSAIGLATAAAVAFMTVSGAGAGGEFRSRTRMPVLAGTTADATESLGAHSPVSSSGIATEAPGAPGRSYTLGPMMTTTGPGRVTNDFSVPDPADRDGPPLIRVVQHLWRDGAEPPADDGKDDLVARTICGSAPTGCALARTNQFHA
jgi:RNA polymerase sigma factor (sigma-70 family)